MKVSPRWMPSRCTLSVVIRRPTSLIDLITARATETEMTATVVKIEYLVNNLLKDCRLLLSFSYLLYYNKGTCVYIAPSHQE